MTVTIKITKCGECPHHKVGPTYSLDGFDRGEDWTCEKANRQIAGFVERPSEQPKTAPSWCPLKPARAISKKSKGARKK